MIILHPLLTSPRESPRKPYILIFTHISAEREAASLLEALANSLAYLGRCPQYVIFTTFQERADGSLRLGTWPFSIVPGFRSVLTLPQEQHQKLVQTFLCQIFFRYSLKSGERSMQRQLLRRIKALKKP